MSGIWDASGGSSSPYEIKGNWNATANTPDLTTVTQAQNAYVVSVPGTFNLGGITTWNLNDIAVKTQNGWARITPASATWGTLTGTLSNQTDIQNALDLKANISTTVALTGDQSIAGIKTFIDSPIIPTPDADMEASTKKYVDDEIAITNRILYNELSSGLKSGMALSVNADPTMINISAGYGIVVDNSNPASPILYEINLPTGLSNIAITNIATANATYIAIDKDSNVVQKTTGFTPEERRSLIVLGAAIHSNRTIVNVVNNLPDVSISATSQVNDLISGLGNFNISGNIFSANGANLQINKSVGRIFKKGANFTTSADSPHILELPALVAPSTIRYRLQNGTEYANTNSIDPNNYDLNGVLTAVTANNPYTIQHITIFPSNLVRIQYGQHLYKSEAKAIQAMSNESFVTEANIAENGLFRGFLIVARGETNLQNAKFFEAGRFGVTDISLSGGSATTTLQQAYDNSLRPQITTTSTGGAVQVMRGTAADTDNIFEGLNGAGAVKHAVKGNGNIVMPRESGTGFMVDPASPTYGWRDLIGEIIPRVGGGQAPALSAFRGGAVKYYAFSTGDVIDNVSCHIQHDYVPGTDLYLHAHWSHNGTAISGNLGIRWFFTYSKGYNQAGNIFTVEKQYDMTIPITSITTHPRYGHFINEFQLSTPGGSATLLDSNLIEVDGLIGIALRVTSIPTITGGTPNLPFILLTDVHYQSTQMSTKGRNYPFY